MGQKLGRGTLAPAAQPYCGLSRKSIATVWQVFNDVADGFGISTDEFCEICADLHMELNVSRLSMMELSTALFRVLDTDNNDLIDALEFCCAIACISGMRFSEIIEFVLSIYDFDSSHLLSVDEVTLALKSTACGLSKLFLFNPPREELVEELVTILFFDELGQDVTDMSRLKISLLTDRLIEHPDAGCWYSYVGSVPQKGLQSLDTKDIADEYKSENINIVRTDQQSNAISWNMRCTRNKQPEVDVVATPWLSAVAMLIPVQFSNVIINKNPPNNSLQLEWIHGYQSSKCRNNVHYNFQGDVVYNISKYVIVYNFGNHSQRIFTSHTDEVLSLSLHPKKMIAATGEAGSKPKLLVWDTVTLEILFCDQNFHRKGIIHTAFSSDGNMLAAISNDKYHTLSVYHWTDNTIVFSTRVDQDQCLALAFLLDGTLAVGGTSYVYFWARTKEGFTKKAANYSRHTTLQSTTCMAQVGKTDNLVSGTNSGQLFLWADRNCIRVVKGHDGAVDALHSCIHGVLSGGRDKRVRLWTHALDPGATFDIASFGCNPSIRAVCMSSDGATLLVGTLGANIYEMSAIDGSDMRGGAITNGHALGNLNCVATHPSKHEYATVGDDKFLRIWDIQTRSLLKVAKFDADARAVTYSPMGDVLVVGLGGDAKHAKCGAYVVLNEEDLSVTHEARDSASSVSLVCYSPEGETLAVGSCDGSVYLYAVQDDYELIGRCIRHTSRVTQLDFSQDGEWLRTNSIGKELCFFNSDDASFQSNYPSMRDVQWANSTCLYSWHAKAIHNSSFAGETVTEAHVLSTVSSNFMASASNFGHIRLHPYPCVMDDSVCHRYPAHADEISGIRFEYDGDHIVSIGLHDACIIQWKCTTYEDQIGTTEYDPPESDDYVIEARGGSEVDEEMMPVACDLGDAFLSLLPGQDVKLRSNPDTDVWMESVVQPSNPPQQHTGIPQLNLQLEYVYGFRCQDMRNNLRYTKTGELVFVCATLGITMSRLTRAQNFYQRHTDAITAFACSKSGEYAATGQLGHTPFVTVWDTATCRTVASLPDFHMKSVTNIAFAPNESIIATVSLDENHTITVYDWRRCLALSRFYGGFHRILDICFGEDNKSLTTCGVKDITFYSQIACRVPVSTKPSLGEIGAMQVYLTCRSFAGKPVIGTNDGNLYVFAKGTLKHSIKAHTGAVYAMDVNQRGDLLVTGGRDGAIRVWSSSFDCTKEITVDSLITSQNPRVRSVSFNADGSNVIIGTRGFEIFEVVLRSATLVGGRALLSSHGCRDLRGLATHPTKDEFVTSGDDMTFRVWESKTFTLLKTVKMDTASRCITYSPDGKYIAAGFGSSKRLRGKAAAKEGSFVVLSATDMKLVHEGKDSNESIRVIKFSPDGQTLACGSEDSKIYIYNVKDHFFRKAVVSTHKAAVLYIDFSNDGSFIMSVDSTRRIRFSDVSSGLEIPSPAALRDEKWATWTSPVGWPVQGLWMLQPENVALTSLQRSCSKLLLCAGNNAGRLYVVHNPCNDKSGCVGAVGHSGPISQVSWLAGDGAILSTGSTDHAIMQWRCVYDTCRESADEGGVSCEDSEVERDGGHEFKSSDIVRTTQNIGHVPQWISAICPPSYNIVDNVTMPNLDAEFDFGHGVRIGDCRQTLCYNEDGHLICAMSTLGIIFDRNDNSQKCYYGHKHAIISLSVDTSGKIAATGELHDNPEVHVWDCKTATEIKVFSNVHKQGITSIAFSKSGEFLVTLGQDCMHSLVVYRSPSKRWIDGFVQYSMPVSVNKMLWTLYVEGNENPVVVGGKGSVMFFRRSGKTAIGLRGEFGKRRKIQPILCAVEGETQQNGLGQTTILTGTVSGHVYVWLDHRVKSVTTAHDSAINAIAKYKGGFITGGKEGLIKIWSLEMQLIYTHNLQSFSPQPLHQSCHSLRCNMLNTRVVVGTRSGEVYDIALATRSCVLLIEGHGYRELHGLALNPQNSDEYATTGDDGTLRVWSLSKRCGQRRLALECASRALAWSPDGLTLVVGIGGDPTSTTKDGAFMVINAQSLEIAFEDRKAKQCITDVKFSPNQEFVAIASMDGKVYLHNAQNWSLVKAIEMPASKTSICCVDFSQDCVHLRISTYLEEMYYYSIPQAEMLTMPTTSRDVEWHTLSCPFTWITQGVWNISALGDNVVSLAVSSRRQWVAVSYQSGEVRIYRFPCQTQGWPYISILGIASQATRMSFSADDSYLILLDGFSRAIITYKLTVL